MKLRWRRRYGFGLLVALLLTVFICAALASRIFYFVRAGQAAVLQRFFTGTVTDRVYGEGLQIVFPWNSLYLYDIREQESTQVVDVLSFNGLSITVVFSFRFHPVPEALGLLHQKLGPDYVEKVVNPVLIAGVREVIGHYRPEELYTTHSATIQDEIRQVCQRDIEQNHIAFRQILVKDIDLPEKVSAAIEDKLVLQQEAEGYDFRLMSEERERLRKKIEAEGIREYNRIVSEAPVTPLLQYKRLDVLQALATSENAKVVLLGGEGSDGVSLPIFMDDLRTSPSGARAGDNSAGASSGAAARNGQATGKTPSVPSSLDAADSSALKEGEEGDASAKKASENATEKPHDQSSEKPLNGRETRRDAAGAGDVRSQNNGRSGERTGTSSPARSTSSVDSSSPFERRDKAAPTGEPVNNRRRPATPPAKDASTQKNASPRSSMPPASQSAEQEKP